MDGNITTATNMTNAKTAGNVTGEILQLPIL